MSELVRETDGARFANRPTREAIRGATSSAQVRQEVRQSAESHGEFVNVRRVKPDLIATVYYHEPAYLLGEAAWAHFGKPDNLIWCERLPGKNAALIVVVRDGQVYLDAEIPPASLADDLLSLMEDDNEKRHEQFDVYVWGDVPLIAPHQPTSPGQFALHESRVSKFEVLDAPAFLQLSVDDSVQLKSLSKALRDAKIGTHPAVTALLVAGILAGGWTFYETVLVEPPPPPPPPVDPFEGLKAALRSPSPAEQLIELSRAMTSLLHLSGWWSEDVVFANAALTAKMGNQGGDLATLQSWAKQNNFVLQLNANGTLLSRSIDAPMRPIPTQVHSATETLAYLADGLGRIGASGATVSAAVVHGAFRETDATVRLEQQVPSVLRDIARLVRDLPVVLKEANLKQVDGLIEGTLTLTVYGS